jgi:hypothetical protein
MFQLGNTLGYYLNDIACADLTGAHFIAVHKKFGLSMPDLLVTHPPPNPLPAKDFVGTVYMNQDKNLSDPTLRDPRYAFFHNLPDLIPNSRPLEASEVSYYVVFAYCALFLAPRRGKSCRHVCPVSYFGLG